MIKLPMNLRLCLGGENLKKRNEPGQDHYKSRSDHKQV
jgi:hypothetical protein